MRYVFCETESPDEHWGYLDVDGKVVLDLGCGNFGGEVTQSTPEFFIERGASKVIGVDVWIDSLNHIEHPDIALIGMSIDNADEIANLIRRFTPDVIKCDIEGGERHLLDLPDNVLQTVKAYAIETHDDDLYDRAWQVLRGNGYKIRTTVDLLHAQPCKVVHATK